jgi:hypothetical protein
MSDGTGVIDSNSPMGRKDGRRVSVTHGPLSYVNLYSISMGDIYTRACLFAPNSRADILSSQYQAVIDRIFSLDFDAAGTLFDVKFFFLLLPRRSISFPRAYRDRLRTDCRPAALQGTRLSSTRQTCACFAARLLVAARSTRHDRADGYADSDVRSLRDAFLAR